MFHALELLSTYNTLKFEYAKKYLRQPTIHYELSHVLKYVTVSRLLFNVVFVPRFLVAHNKPEYDAHWASTEREWLGRASMSGLLEGSL